MIRLRLSDLAPGKEIYGEGLVFKGGSHSSTLAIRELEYVESARALGASSLRIILWAILPNIIAPILVQASLAAGHAILMESTPKHDSTVKGPDFAITLRFNVRIDAGRSQPTQVDVILLGHLFLGVTGVGVDDGDGLRAGAVLDVAVVLAAVRALVHLDDFAAEEQQC